jgi:hypothetical protein
MLDKLNITYAYQKSKYKYFHFDLIHTLTLVSLK